MCIYFLVSNNSAILVVLPGGLLPSLGCRWCDEFGQFQTKRQYQYLVGTPSDTKQDNPTHLKSNANEILTKVSKFLTMPPLFRVLTKALK